MAGNPLQEMIPMVLQQLMQNPQMLQQIVQQVGPLLQMAGGGAGSTMPGGTGYIPPSGRMNQMLGGEVPLQSREQGAAKSLRWEKEEIPRAMQRTPTNNRRPMTPGLQRSIDDDPRGVEDYRNRVLPEEIMQPGETEPIAQRIQPGLLTRLASLSQTLDPSIEQLIAQQQGPRIPRPDIDFALGDYLPDTPDDDTEGEE